ncbi:bacteriocin-protection, YdeI or OmpD-associated-domain-containing protein [Hypoxylon rubiginosum]|uniref:Bacteriocin-protection, YdeI or OmpD-associated-domain-containing protein n=1 Tax=Hypoxylon rubiginosum TaxID=110542 RepID=A0ACB9ZEE2_9PEZI|nr:bacteriocin-protection, YdeI or OmpD-associated-domain-containing protein [Hypoxylon rubiginosum]
MSVVLPTLTVSDVATWSSWLFRSGATSKGVWLTLAKKGATAPTSLTYAQALDEALCHGWIDGQVRKGEGSDAKMSFLQRFTPRAARSAWSSRNVANVGRLEREGRMTEAGNRAVDAAKADGRWDAAYSGQATAELPPEFLAAVAAVPAAQATYEVLTRQNRFAIYYRLVSLKTQAGRERRIAAFVDMLARSETPYPQKQLVRSSALVALDIASTTEKEINRPGTRRPIPTRRSARLSGQNN